MAKNSFHVVPNPKGGWAVKKGGASRASKHFDTKESAIVWGRQLSRTEGGEFVIHRRDGMIRSRDTFDRDPDPPRVRANRK